MRINMACVLIGVFLVFHGAISNVCGIIGCVLIFEEAAILAWECHRMGPTESKT